MKKNLLFTITLAAIIAAFSTHSSAQTDYELDASALTPDDSGYYIIGVYKDKDPVDGVDEWYYGCDDEYGDSDHKETGWQQGFYYENCMIMPTCTSKYCDGVETICNYEGYIQIGRIDYWGTDSQFMSCIISPTIDTLESISLIASPDISPKTDRHIIFKIDYSKDEGATWDANNVVEGDVTTKGEQSFLFEEGSYAALDTMIAASYKGPIILRIRSNEIEGQNQQRLKVHRLTITADTAVWEHTGIKQVVSDRNTFEVREGLIISYTGSVTVFDILGRMVGKGTSVTVRSGIYIIRTSRGYAHRVYVR